MKYPIAFFHTFASVFSKDVTVMVLQTPELYYAAAGLVLVCSSLFCAFVRCFHMCRPFDKQESYFYPARRLMTFIFACFALPGVWLCRMDSADAWLFVRVFLVLFLPVAGILSFRRYFFAGVRRRWLYLAVAGVLPLLLIAVLWVFAWMGGDVLWRRADVVLPCVGAYALLLTVGMVRTTWWLCLQIRKHQYEEYSNEDDFPMRFARLVVFFPLIYIVAAWVLFFTGSHTYNMYLQLSIAVMHVVILLQILHPQRHECRQAVGEAEAFVEQKVETLLTEQKALEDDVRSSWSLSAEVKDGLEVKIRAVLTEQQLYLNPNLKLDDLAAAVKSNRKYVSLVMNERFGSFYKELNRLRVEAALEYKKKNPAATREEVALHSGFASVKTYSRNLDAYRKGKE